MYDMKPLEEEWKQYKKKKLKPWYLGIFISFIFIIASFLFVNTKKIDFDWFNKYVDKYSNTTEIDKSLSNYKIVLNGPLKKLQLEKKVISMINKEVEKTANILVDIPILDIANEPVTDKTPHIRKKINFNMVESSSISAYKDVENRFHQSKDVNDALFLAKSYYKKGNYAKAEYWALETNKMDENIEESLLIFVKSKVKLGRKNEAIGILMTYVNKTDSIMAKNLLYKIKNDKF